MRIGTLSFPRNGNFQLLTGNEQAIRIRDIGIHYKPDLLVCAGHSLIENEELTHVEEISVKVPETSVLVEVQNDQAAASEKSAHPNRSLHAMYAITSAGTRRLGSQVFVNSAEVQGKSEFREAELREQFNEALPNRKFAVGNHSCMAICCGEINLLQGRNDVTVRWPEVIESLKSVEIIVNPTHDRMGNAGTLIAKRQFVSGSLDQQSRCYVSVSNWNLITRSGAQKSNSPTLHTVFVGGKSVRMERISFGPDHEYREAIVSL
jgi:hypothetical protein